MHDAIDSIHTLFLSFGVFSLVGALMLAIQFKWKPEQYIQSWTLGMALGGIATLLIAFEDFAPALLSHKIGTALSVASYVYFYYSSVSLLGKKIDLTRVSIEAFAAAIIFIVSLFWIINTFGRAYQPAWVSFSGLVFNLALFLRIFELRRRLKIEMLLTLSIILFLIAAAWAVRFSMILLGLTGFLADGGLNTWLAFTLLLGLNVAKYLAFFGLVANIERNRKEELIKQFSAMKVDLARKDSDLAIKRAEKTEDLLLSSLNALAKARDNETGNHILRTQHYVERIALRLRADGYYVDNLSDQAISALVRAAPLHDIGKVGIPDEILLKNDRLTEDEWEVMKTHATIGEAVLGATHFTTESDSLVISKAIKVAGGHHEKWDGSGYPRGLAEQAIPLEARIMSLADMYDALVSDRPYKQAWSHEQAVKEITSKRGTHFEPAIVDAFMSERESFIKIAEKYKD